MVKHSWTPLPKNPIEYNFFVGGREIFWLKCKMKRMSTLVLASVQGSGKLLKALGSNFTLCHSFITSEMGLPVYLTAC